jgi:hypothetical protein
VKCLVRTWRLPLRTLALVLIAAAVPWPCLAGDPGQPAAKPRLQASIGPIAKDIATRPAPAARPAARAAQASKEDLGSTSFFRKPAGLAVLAVVAAGAGYAIYSASHDRIHSTVPPGLK